MNERLKKLYRSQVMKMAKAADESKIPNKYNYQLEAYNPMCGDKFSVYLRIENNVIVESGMTGFGCAISKASTYLLTKALIDNTIQEAIQIAENFLALTNVKSERSPEDIFESDEFLAFAGAREFPERKSCANLSWEESIDLFQKIL